MKNFNLNLFSKYRGQLMGIAIISIMLFHGAEDMSNAIHTGEISIANQQFLIYNLNRILMFIGSIGVEIFLFLSGLGLYYSFSKNENIKDFYIKRFKRVILPYLILASIYLIIQDIYFLKMNLIDYFLDLTFILFFTKGSKLYWYIGLSIILYFLYPFIYKFFKKDGIKKFIISTIIYTIILLGLYFIAHSFFKNTEIALTRVPIFIFGSVMAPYIIRKKDIKLSYTLITMISCFILKILILFLPRNTFISRYGASVFAIGLIIFFILILDYLNKKKITINLLNIAGKYSLELFMIHVSIRRLFNYSGIRTYKPLNYLLVIIISIILSYLYKKLCDKIIK